MREESLVGQQGRVTPRPISHEKQSESYHYATDSTHLGEEGVRGIVDGERV